MLIFTQIIILLLVKFSDGRTNHDLKDFQLHAEQEAWEKANKTPEENNDNEVKDGEGDNTQEADNDDTKKSSETPQAIIYKACEDEELALMDTDGVECAEASDGNAFCDVMENRENCKRSCCKFHGYWLSGGRFIGVRNKKEDPRGEDFLRHQVALKLQKRSAIIKDDDKKSSFDKHWTNAHELEIRFI